MNLEFWAMVVLGLFFLQVLDNAQKDFESYHDRVIAANLKPLKEFRKCP